LLAHPFRHSQHSHFSTTYLSKQPTHNPKQPRLHNKYKNEHIPQIFTLAQPFSFRNLFLFIITSLALAILLTINLAQFHPSRLSYSISKTEQTQNEVSISPIPSPSSVFDSEEGTEVSMGGHHGLRSVAYFVNWYVLFFVFVFVVPTVSH